MSGNGGSRIVQIVHLAVIAYIICGPYLKHRFSSHLTKPICKSLPLSLYDILYLASAMALLVHWKLGSDICALSKIEEYLSGRHYTNGFIHRLVSPIYNVPQLGPQITFWSYVVVIFNCVVILGQNTKITG